MYEERENYKYEIIFILRKYGTLSLAQLMENVLGHRDFSGKSVEGIFYKIILDFYKVKFLTMNIQEKKALRG